MYRKKPNDNSVVLAESADATCLELFALSRAENGPTVLKMQKSNYLRPNCSFPMWLTHNRHWHILSSSSEAQLKFSFSNQQGFFRAYNKSSGSVMMRATCVASGTPETDFSLIAGFERDMPQSLELRSQRAARQGTTPTYMNQAGVRRSHTRPSNNVPKWHRMQASVSTTEARFVVHVTEGCEKGYKCLAFRRRGDQVAQVRQGRLASFGHQACSSPYFEDASHISTPFALSDWHTLVAASPKPEACQFTGEFSIPTGNMPPGLLRGTADARSSLYRCRDFYQVVSGCGNGQDSTSVHVQGHPQSEDRCGDRQFPVNSPLSIPSKLNLAIAKEDNI